jgi:hypothetical protein
MSVGRRLQQLADAAGYGPEALGLLAEVTLPRHRGEELTEAERGHLAEAVEVAFLAPLDETELFAAIQRHRDSAEDWRTAFWRETLDAANASYNAAISSRPAA